MSPVDEYIIQEAKQLLEPGEEYDNPEYTRALVEIVARSTGISCEDAASRLGVDYAKVHNACKVKCAKSERFFNVVNCVVKCPPKVQDELLRGKYLGQALGEYNMNIDGVTVEVMPTGVISIRPQTQEERDQRLKLTADSYSPHKNDSDHANKPLDELDTSPILRRLIDVLNIEITGADPDDLVVVIRTDSKLLCGTPPIGDGKTLGESLAVLFARVIGQDRSIEGIPGYTRTLHDALVKAGI